ncbi:MAG: hypothetical protein SGPRY_002295, partial [Prymnesium sp.]
MEVTVAVVLMEQPAYKAPCARNGRVVFGDSWFTFATGPERGDWAIYSSMLKLNGESTIPIYMVLHKRGESVVHEFIATSTTTPTCNSLEAAFDDDNHREGQVGKPDYEVACKCPRVLNGCTLEQPVGSKTGVLVAILRAREGHYTKGGYPYYIFYASRTPPQGKNKKKARPDSGGISYESSDGKAHDEG